MRLITHTSLSVELSLFMVRTSVDKDGEQDAAGQLAINPGFGRRFGCGLGDMVL
jgi:hypothetical protein